MTDRKRSPRYPSMDLESAVLAVKSIFRSEGKSTFPTESLARAMGYKSLSGSTRAKIGSLNQFGLIESVSNGRYRLSDRALSLAVSDETSTHFQDALEQTAYFPEIFDEIHREYAEASDNTLRHELIVQKGFGSEAADRLIAAYRKTADYASSVAKQSEHVVDDKQNSSATAPSSQRHFETDFRVQSAGTESKSVSSTFLLRQSLSATISFHGSTPSEEDFEVLKDYMEVMKRAVQRAQSDDATDE